MISYIRIKLKNQLIRVIDWRDSLLVYIYKKKALLPIDGNMFRGKRVAIVGGADSAYKDKLGDVIDGYDVVVRINNGVRVIEKYSDCIGKRTDFLFHTFYEDLKGGGSPVELDLWTANKVQNIVFSHHFDNNQYGKHLKTFLLKTKGKVTVLQFERALSDISCYQLINPYHPTTGLIAIHNILYYQPKEIYVTGITFFKTSHQEEYRKGSLDQWKDFFKNKYCMHDPESEYLAFKELYMQNRLVFNLDRTLQEIINRDTK